MRIEKGRSYVEVALFGTKLRGMHACPDCGAIVADTTAHDAFHAAFIVIARKATAAEASARGGAF